MQNIEGDLPGSPAEVPKKLTFVGASLMFFAVVTVALARLPARQLPQPQPGAAATEEAEPAELTERETNVSNHITKERKNTRKLEIAN